MSSPTPLPRPDYGVDAPPVIRNLLLAAGAGLVLAIVLQLAAVPYPGGFPLRDMALGAFAGCLLSAGGMFWYSKVRKVRARERFLNLVPWRGDEKVLDVGCGRGLLLLGAAKRLTTGKAVGVDIWQTEDLAGNNPEATTENARREGVADRVELHTADARQLPFPDASFDVILSSLALHNIYDTAERQKAVREIARVLKPGGYVVLIDIRHTTEYARVLRECGLADIERTATSGWTWPVLLMTMGTVHPCRVTGRKLPPLPVPETPTR